MVSKVYSVFKRAEYIMRKVKDYSKIKAVHIDFPELMTEGAEESIIMLFNKISELKERAADLRIEATNVDKQREALEAQWNKLLPLITIEYEEVEVVDQYIDSAKGVMFNFSSEINKKVH